MSNGWGFESGTFTRGVCCFPAFSPRTVLTLGRCLALAKSLIQEHCDLNLHWLLSRTPTLRTSQVSVGEHHMRTAHSSQHHDLSQVTVLMTDRKGQKWGLRSLWVCMCVSHPRSGTFLRPPVCKWEWFLSEEAATMRLGTCWLVPGHGM